MEDITTDTTDGRLLSREELGLLATRLNNEWAHAAYDNMFCEVNEAASGLLIHTIVEGQHCPVNSVVTWVGERIELRMPGGTIIVFKPHALDATHPCWNN